MINFQQRIVVTGIGIITSLGTGIEKNFKDIISGKSGIKPIDLFDTKFYRNNLYAYISDVDIGREFSKKEKDRTDRCYKLLEIAAKNAIDDAKLSNEEISSSKVGLYLGSIMAGDFFAHELQSTMLKHKKYLRNNAYFMQKHVYADLLARKLQINGPRMLISTACTASTVAISIAAQSILSGQVDFAFAGGSDPASEYIFAGFHNMRNISMEACAPFSTPEGMTLGEGAGFLLLERLDKALERNARVYAELIGFAMTADANHPTSPDLSGKSHQRLMEKAMIDSGISKLDIGYINVHGTGTKANDKTESVGLNRLFGDDTNKILVSSIKGAVGHILGGAGVVEAAVTIMSIYQQQLIPNVGFNGNREGCDLNIIVENKPLDFDIALSNNYAFGGNNASLVFSKFNSQPNSKISVKRKEDKIVITGIGIISPLGNNKDQLIANLKNDNKSINCSNNIPYFSLTNEKLEDIVKYDTRRADRLGKVILAATQLAFDDAGLGEGIIDLDDLGIISGTAHSHLTSNMAFNEMISKGEPQFGNPIDFANSVTNAGCGLASINLAAKGCNIAISSGQISGIQSIALGYELIKSGREKAVICGGADCLDEFILNSIAGIFKTPRTKDLQIINNVLNGATEKAIFGEGGCYFVLETEESAKARGAHIYCELQGYGTFGGIESESICGDVEISIEMSMKDALNKTQKKPNDISYVIRSDLLMKHQQLGEINAIKKMFGRDILHKTFTPNFGVSSALGPLSLASVIYTQNSKSEKKQSNRSILLNSMSFGGNTCSLILSLPRYRPCILNNSSII
ncbi:MAG: hypothetical protein H0U75_07290 [Legionella sp.]|nr:hypothetical protein [Legionella sp.]